MSRLRQTAQQTAGHQLPQGAKVHSNKKVKKGKKNAKTQAEIMAIITKDFYKKGSHNSLSDYSGQKYKRSDMRLTWDNKLVGIDEWEAKHPQLTIRPRPDRPAITDQTRVSGQTETLLDPPFDPTGSV